MAFAVMVESAAVPPHRVDIPIAAVVQAAGGRLTDGGTIETADGTSLQFRQDTFWLSRLSPGACRLIFEAARQVSGYVNTGGANVTPIIVEGSTRQTPRELGRPVRASTAAQLCAELGSRLTAWNRDVRAAQAEGLMDKDESLIEAPASLGSDAIIEADATDIAARCETMAREMAGKLNWRIVTTVIAQNPDWGVVWRADVATDDPVSLFRYVCLVRPGSHDPRMLWFATRPLEMFDPRQSIRPLKEELAR